MQTDTVHDAQVRNTERTMNIKLSLAALLLGVLGLVMPVGAAEPFPVHGDAMLVLSNAIWWVGKLQEPRNIALRLQRLDGAWDPVVVGHTIRGQNASHYGFITESAAEPDGAQRLKLRLFVRPDRWIGGEGHAAYTLKLQYSGEACSGTWTGVVQGVRASGALSGEWEAVQRPAGYAAPASGERPRLLMRKSDLPGLRERIATPEDQATLAALKADGSVVAQAFVYALTGDAACGQKALAALDGPCNPQRGWWHHTGGDQHGPAIRIVEHLIAYDLAYDLCTPEMHAGLRENIANNLDLYYWGALNSQFNPNDTSNWSLLYRSALGLMGLTLLDAPPSAPDSGADEAAGAAAPAFPRLSPPAGFAPAGDTPVARWKADDKGVLRPWLFAGPVAERCRDDAFAAAGGTGALRPVAGGSIAGNTFRVLAETEYKDVSVDLAKLTGRKPYLGCYLYTVLEMPEAGYYRLETTGVKGTRFQKAYIAGHAMECRDYVYLAAGRYPMAVRVWTEPVGGWEPLVFWAKLEPATEAAALGWQAGRESIAAADAECGVGWRERLVRETGRNLDAWAYARMAAYRAEKYFVRGLGDFGWDQEGGYTRHAMHLAMPFAQCFRNTFGRDIRGADRAGKWLALASACTIFSENGATMQTYSSGGGPMDLTLFARGFNLVPDALRPAVLWTWNRADELAKAGKYKDINRISAQYDSLSTIMRFISVPPTLKEENPEGILSRVTVDRQKGGYVFRNRWKDGDDCVVQLFANCNCAGGSWSSYESGDLRIDGLGVSWAVRGQGYGQGSYREVLDSSAQQSMVDVGEQYFNGTPAWTTHFAPEKDGSGIVSLNMDDVYIHYPKVATVVTNRGRESLSIKAAGGPTNLGIRAVRSLAVDYSGASGAPCLVAVADRLSGTRGSNTWTLVTEKEHIVTVTNNVFVIAATNGATLRGTVVRPANATLRLASSEFGHEVNYRGNHAHTRFKRTMIKADGRDKDQDFLVVMTIQRGDAPAVAIAGKGSDVRATVGRRSVNFDGQKLLLDSAK